jgi:hypothetical protein
MDPIYTYRASFPVTHRGMGKVRDGALTEELPGLDLSLQAQNLVFHSAELLLVPIEAIDTLSSRLPIWIEIAPRDGPVRFDPAKLRVVSTAGDSLAPMGFWGPGVARYVAGALPSCACGLPEPGRPLDLTAPYHRRWVAYDTCFNCITKRHHELVVGKPVAPTIHPIEGPIEVREPTCFVLIYDRSYRELEFTLWVDGLEVGDHAVPPQAIAFKKGTYSRNNQPW